jgi:hypothetical protein
LKASLPLVLGASNPGPLSPGQELVNIKWTPPPRMLVGEFDKPRHDAAPALDGVDHQATRAHRSAPSIDHRVKHCLVSPERRNVIET